MGKLPNPPAGLAEKSRLHEDAARRSECEREREAAATPSGAERQPAQKIRIGPEDV